MILLADTGYIQVHAYASYARIPLPNVTVAVTAADGTAIAIRTTDRSGRIAPVALPVPDRWESQTPDPSERPYATVNLTARLRDYEQIFVKGLQVFSNVTTAQDLPLIPLSELPESRNRSEEFDTPPQNL